VNIKIKSTILQAYSFASETTSINSTKKKNNLVKQGKGENNNSKRVNYEVPSYISIVNTNDLRYTVAVALKVVKERNKEKREIEPDTPALESTT
jgi:hypothetical protein